MAFSFLYSGVCPEIYHLRPPAPMLDSLPILKDPEDVTDWSSFVLALCSQFALSQAEVSRRLRVRPATITAWVHKDHEIRETSKLALLNLYRELRRLELRRRRA